MSDDQFKELKDHIILMTFLLWVVMTLLFLAASCAREGQSDRILNAIKESKR